MCIKVTINAPLSSDCLTPPTSLAERLGLKILRNSAHSTVNKRKEQNA